MQNTSARVKQLVGQMRQYRYVLGIGYDPVLANWTTDGYSETVVLALMAGAVPICVGSHANTHVFNPRRIIAAPLDYGPRNHSGRPIFDADARPAAELVRRLDTDASFRAEWFGQPVLAPTARTWLRAWAGTVGEQLRAGLERVQAARKRGDAGSAPLADSAAERDVITAARQHEAEYFAMLTQETIE
jgi:hypothetical protein